MKFFTYILNSLKNNSYYIGQTNNIDRRLVDHNRGKDHSSKIGMPWKIVFLKEFENRKDAVRYEKYLKSLKSRKSLEKFIVGTDK